MTKVAEQTNALAPIVKGYQLVPGVAEQIVTTFVPLAEAAAETIRDSEKIAVTDATQVTEIKASRDARLKLKANRVAVEKARKAMKEEYLRPGQAIDAVARYIAEQIEPAEERLRANEEFAERAEAERKNRLACERAKLVQQYADPGPYSLGEMKQEEFDQLLSGLKLAHEARIEAERKAEKERAEAEAKRLAEEKRIREENERLRAEAKKKEREAAIERERAAKERQADEEKARKEREAIEAKARQEREKAEAELRKEREARAEADRKLAEQREAEQKRKAAEEKARRDAEKAPDRQKIKAVANAIRSIPAPALSSKDTVDKLRGIIESAADQIDALANL